MTFQDDPKKSKKFFSEKELREPIGKIFKKQKITKTKNKPPVLTLELGGQTRLARSSNKKRQETKKLSKRMLDLSLEDKEINLDRKVNKKKQYRVCIDRKRKIYSFFTDFVDNVDELHKEKNKLKKDNDFYLTQRKLYVMNNLLYITHELFGLLNFRMEYSGEEERYKYVNQVTDEAMYYFYGVVKRLVEEWIIIPKKKYKKTCVTGENCLEALKNLEFKSNIKQNYEIFKSSFNEDIYEKLKYKKDREKMVKNKMKKILKKENKEILKKKK